MPCAISVDVLRRRPAGIAHSTASNSDKHRALTCSVPPCADGGGGVWRQPGRAGRGEFRRLRALPREVRTGCGGFTSSRVSEQGIVDRRLKPLCNNAVACCRIAGFQAALHDLGTCSCPLHTLKDDHNHMRAAATLTGAGFGEGSYTFLSCVQMRSSAASARRQSSGLASCPASLGASRRWVFILWRLAHLQAQTLNGFLMSLECPDPRLILAPAGSASSVAA